MLSVSGQREKQYIRAFLELFESGYAPHVGDAERVAGRKVKRLFVTLPQNYHDWLFNYHYEHHFIHGEFHPILVKQYKCCIIC